LLSIAKGANRKALTETIFTAQGQIEFPKNSNALKLLLYARDEAHRFAIKANRNVKNKSMRFSLLDSIKGIGPERKRILIKRFKSIKNIKQASIQEISNLPSFSVNLANEVIKVTTQ